MLTGVDPGMDRTYVFRALATKADNPEGRHLTFIKERARKDPREDEYGDAWELVVTKIMAFIATLPKAAVYREGTADRLGVKSPDGTCEPHEDDEFIEFECWGPVKTVEVLAKGDPSGATVEAFDAFFTDLQAETIQISDHKLLERTFSRLRQKEIPCFNVKRGKWMQVTLPNGGLSVAVQVED